MAIRPTDQFERALQKAARGEPFDPEMAPLVELTREVADLSAPSPQTEGGLATGRQRFLAEAARPRHRPARSVVQPVWAGGLRLGGAVVAIVLVLMLVFGAGHTAAGSLPGDPLYGLKRAGEWARLALTRQGQARAGIALDLVAERLDETIALLERGQMPDAVTTWRIEQQMAAAANAAASLGEPARSEARLRLETAIRHRQQAIEDLAGEVPSPPMRELLREMERVRQDLHAGQGEAAGQQQRERKATPPVPTDPPLPGQTQIPRLAPHRPGPEATPTQRESGQQGSPTPPGGSPVAPGQVGEGETPTHTPLPTPTPPGALRAATDAPGPQPTGTPPDGEGGGVPGPGSEPSQPAGGPAPGGGTQSPPPDSPDPSEGEGHRQAKP